MPSLTFTVDNISVSHLKKTVRSVFAILCLSPSFPSGIAFHLCVCWCVCVTRWSLPGGPSNPSSPPTWLSVYPAAHSLPNTAAALPLNQQVMRWELAFTLSVSFSLWQFICLQPLCWLIAYCFCWQLRLVPEQPNKSVIHRRAVCAAAAAKQSTALGFMAGVSTLEYSQLTVFALFDFLLFFKRMMSGSFYLAWLYTRHSMSSCRACLVSSVPLTSDASLPVGLFIHLVIREWSFPGRSRWAVPARERMPCMEGPGPTAPARVAQCHSVFHSW